MLVPALHCQAEDGQELDIEIRSDGKLIIIADDAAA